MKKHTHDREFFNLVSPISCYWAGFIASDGSIGQYGAISIVLARKDREHLIKFKNIIQQTSDVRDFITSNGYEASQFQMYGAYECQEALKNIFNITPAKSLTLEPPNLENKFHIQSFIRGYMDGDGSISYSGSGRNNHWTVSFLGTENMLGWIKQQIQKYVKDVGNPSVLPDRNTFQLIFGGEQTKRILDWLYDMSGPSVRLERKYQKYLEVCEFYKIERVYSSKYVGVNYFKRTGKWKAEIKHQKQRYHLGYFDTDYEAALAYNNKARELGLLERCYDVR